MNVAVGFNPRNVGQTDLAESAANESLVAIATRGLIFQLPWVETHGYNQRSLCDQNKKGRFDAA